MPQPSLSRPGLVLLAFVVLVTSALIAYGCLPSLRLAFHQRDVSGISQAHWVNAHQYDQDWFDAARAGRVDILRALYEAHYPINSRTSQGYTAVILAAYDEQPAALDYLLSIGANPCLGDRNGNTALMGALYKGNSSIAERLLKTHCPIDSVNNAGETALSFAALFGRLEFLSTIAGQGADLNHADYKGDTPMAIVLKQGDGNAAMALRKLGARG